MANVILGLLLIAPQSLYDLVKNFERGVSLLYSASAGSIKRAIDGMLGQGLIEVASAEPGVRGRKVYRATDAGREAFAAWMHSDLTGADAESAALHRFHFLGLFEAEERVVTLERIVSRLETDLSELSALNEQLEGIDVPEEYQEIADYQLATLEYGLDGHRRALDWFSDRLERERRKSPRSAPPQQSEGPGTQGAE